ncbi:membrane protein insertion efficiency factor YidD [Actinotalea sp. Marseille-Q4924]|uniref:membrane protein insertion efficiency factor YidD n=1 Tax=Actinotalea sp. Marseille-Q4924 TaxID=2866571 RepID=UPI001CE415E1|nr:membrane protein insertion efficiency factor YidD [Actinotalea sp. Marseille-Q4924]
MPSAARAVDALIRGYQRHLSARKGFTCAHLVAHGGTSCSAAVQRILSQRGLLRGAVPTAVRFLACYQAAALLRESNVQGVCCCGGIPVPFRF